MSDIILQQEEAKSLSSCDNNSEEVQQDPILSHSYKKERLLEQGFDEGKIEIVLNSNSQLPLNDLATLLVSLDEIQGICLICQETSAQIIMIPECTHCFCKTCISEYIRCRISESQVLTMPCPNNECRVQLSDTLIKDLTTEGLYSKYERFKAVEELNKDPFLRWCPQTDCTGYDKGSMSKQNLKCSVCGFEYCYYCAEAWHAKTKCKFKQDKDMDKWAKNNGVKYCPNCKRKVEKNLGCDHMTCTKCRYEWCWLCGSKYSSGHYDECEVKKLNKKNPAWEIVLKLFFAPFCIPFMCVILFYLMTHKIGAGSMGGLALINFVRTRKTVSYVIATVLGIIFSPLFFAFAPIMASIAMSVDFVRHNCGRSCPTCLIVMILAILGAPVLVFCILVGACGAHIVGFFLMIWKLYIMIKRCQDPNYLLPNSRYGYA